MKCIFLTHSRHLWFLVIFFIYGTGTVSAQVQTGADQTALYLPLLKDRSVGVVANHTSMIGQTHLVDSLLGSGIEVVKIFGPEHGFRGDAADGTKLSDDLDPETGIPVISLYGSKRKPSAEDVADLDIMVYDIQDVGTRCYTYISTLQYVMEVCAENGIPCLVLDRPNPNGFYVDGPMLDTTQYRSFIGLNAIPLVYGMTVAEYAWMINEEGWLEGGVKCDLQWIPCNGWDHLKYYELPVRPSPNLPNMTSVYLYPSLVLLEGTIMSEGRGTDNPFQIYGHPDYPPVDFSFTPRSIPGVSDHPKYQGELCYGVDLSSVPHSFIRNNRRIVLDWILDAYKQMDAPDDFFNERGFALRAGNSELMEQIREGKAAWWIRNTWKEDLEAFREIRKKYLLYRDF
jgi:uncharacterized protein YbbC (DUF1343 family)